MSPHSSNPKVSPMQWWGTIARRIRVPLGFVTAAIYVYECAHSVPHLRAIAWSLLLVVPGTLIRAISSGTVKKNRELAKTGPYAYTRNPLYFGSALMAAGFAVALQSWLFAAVLASGFALIYIPVIASEERFLRGEFADFDEYCRAVPRFFPRLTPAPLGRASVTSHAPAGFSLKLYRDHREYNAAIGVVMLYLSLLYLRPLLELVWSRVH